MLNWQCQQVASWEFARWMITAFCYDKNDKSTVVMQVRSGHWWLEETCMWSKSNDCDISNQDKERFFFMSWLRIISTCNMADG